MTKQIVFADGASFDCPIQPEAPVSGWPKGNRQWQKISVLSTVEEVKAAFVDGAEYHREWQSQTGEDEQGQPVYETMTEDLSAYSVAGEIVDHRNGVITVFMGKPTEKELLEATIDELVLEVLGGGE